MKGKVIVSRFWTALFSAGKASAVTVFPFIFVKTQAYRTDLVLLNHERIHCRQALELLILPFYMCYMLEFLYHWIRVRNFQRAYLSISFEREAYINQSNLNYLQERKRWAFWVYRKR